MRRSSISSDFKAAFCSSRSGVRAGDLREPASALLSWATSSGVVRGSDHAGPDVAARRGPEDPLDPRLRARCSRARRFRFLPRRSPGRRRSFGSDGGDVGEAVPRSVDHSSDSTRSSSSAFRSFGASRTRCRRSQLHRTFEVDAAVDQPTILARALGIDDQVPVLVDRAASSVAVSTA